MQTLFKEEVIPEFMEWKNTNGENFSWWNYLNIKGDLNTALAFAKFYFPDVLQYEGCFLLKDKFSEELFKSWKNECDGDITCIEKMMNLYQIKDFFHINGVGDGNEGEKVEKLGEIIKLFWEMSFKYRYPDLEIKVDMFQEEDELYITTYRIRVNEK